MSSRWTCASTCSGVPCRNSWLKTSDARSSGGMATPVPVHERLRAAPLTDSVSDGNRVSVADALGHVLVERNRVAERTAGRVRRRGEEADVGRMAAIHVGMRHAAHHGEVVAVRLQ